MSYGGNRGSGISDIADTQGGGRGEFTPPNAGGTPVLKQTCITRKTGAATTNLMQGNQCADIFYT